MGQSGAIWVDKQAYGIGQVDYTGAFTVNGAANTVTVSHGKGFTVAYSANGTYKVKLNTVFKGMLGSGADFVAPAAQGNSYTHPGFALTGDLQSDNQSFNVYAYNFAGSQVDPGTNVLIEFFVTVSNSLTNT